LANTSGAPAKTKRRKVVLDTNVILFDAFALLKFGDADLHIPFAVIEEVDKFKRDQGENGRNARQFSRFVDVLRSKGSLANGVQIDNHETYVYITTDMGFGGIGAELDQSKADNRILSTALGLQKQHPRSKVELISKDINLRIKADVYGIFATDYDNSDVNQEDMYEGYLEIDVTPAAIDSFYKEKKVVVDQKLYINQYVILKDKSNPNHSAIGRFSAD
jgi:PhoH-like ATPase